ncbi:SRF-TF-domain-containing protein [Schizopora paradoxa]|uniref:SRF-TF-domain-containing protein n=1 Tax=Schizopora paradoxa TaxID=27342 RepID=A0A0H2RGI1_9AGAM|nr:SRF-TF-domain-containing protein [Schizopora paradoxa]
MHAADPVNPANAAAPGEPVVAGDGFINDADAAESGGDDDEEEGKPADKKAGRRKIKIEFIQDKSRRHITFSKRKAGIMKKAYELSTLTGTQVLLLVVSETGLVYTFTTAKLQPLVTQPEGKNLIQACLNAPQGSLPSHMPVGTPIGRTAATPHQQGPPAQQIPPPPAANPAQQPVPGQAPPHMQPPRNVPGGLAIGDTEKGEGDAPGSSAGAGSVGDEGDEGDKRGAPRRRTSKAGQGRSPTSPHAAHLAIPQQGQPQAQQQPPPPMAGYPGAPPDGTGAPMYHPQMMGYPPPHYQQPMGGGWPPPAPQQGGQQYGTRR